ncbi:Predicted arabinose efflux permease, MFS family [Faunimonas pinastri]|uniref:Predicted arabinose efflux permease, MFS family n=2 Tax=Faunimonas pinastri TaxID=1855383 RepID=A0A1H9KDJ6_9HYPH|nr:Predicted arabinose efflux permease, MFS family [Faunimonas pinastri]
MAVAMGVGRFYYTPLLPLMQHETGFGAQTAGLIASANFAGYLAGSILASFIPAGRARLWTFRIGILASIATTIAMGFTDNLTAWLILRAISGVASALGMILAAGIAAQALTSIGEAGRVGWLFSGVGTGIALSGMLVHFASGWLDASRLWIAAGVACLIVTPVIFAEVGDRELPGRAVTGARPRRAPRPLSFWPLLAAYSLEGLGYSVFATFIVAIVKSRPGLSAMGDWVWVVAGLAGLPSCVLWPRLGERVGFAVALLLAFLAQIVGVLLPALTASAGGALAGAVLFGGTFLAISTLTVPLGRHGLNGRGFAVLTAGFSIGQMLGPTLAARVIAGPGGYSAALIGSAAVLGVGVVCLVAAMLRSGAATTGEAAVPPA